MAPPIDFGALSDRELLLLTAQTCNLLSDKLDELNGTVREHSARLTKVEVKQKINCQTGRWKDRRFITGATGGIGLLVAAVYALGRALGWW